MAVTSRIPLEFIAVVGVLLVTIAIVEVPRSNMAPPAASALDSQTWRVPEAEPTDAASPVVSERRGRLITHLEASLGQGTRQLARQRAHLASAEAHLLKSPAGARIDHPARQRMEQLSRSLATRRVKLARMQAVLDALREDPGSD